MKEAHVYRRRGLSMIRKINKVSIWSFNSRMLSQSMQRDLLNTGQMKSAWRILSLDFTFRQILCWLGLMQRTVSPVNHSCHVKLSWHQARHQEWIKLYIKRTP